LKYNLSFLDKRECDRILPRLFELLYQNMSVIAPTGESYEEDRAEWLAAVSPAMQKEPRQIILMHDREHLAGYFQYYVNNGTLVVEEIQIAPQYQQTGALLRLCRFLCGVIPRETRFIEAYAHKQNRNSQSVIASLGMVCLGETQNGRLWHYRGDIAPLFARFERKGTE
jgi:hypothetical protein